MEISMPYGLQTTRKAQGKSPRQDDSIINVENEMERGGYKRSDGRSRKAGAAGGGGDKHVKG